MENTSVALSVAIVSRQVADLVTTFLGEITDRDFESEKCGDTALISVEGLATTSQKEEWRVLIQEIVNEYGKRIGDSYQPLQDALVKVGETKKALEEILYNMDKSVGSQMVLDYRSGSFSLGPCES